MGEQYSGRGGACGERERDPREEQAPSILLRPGTRPGQVERGILSQDLPLQLLKRLIRLETELFDELPPRVRIDAERLGLTARAVEGEHQLTAQSLPQRMTPRQNRELGNERLMPAERELGVDPLLDCGETQLLEALDLGPRERLVGEVGECITSPERERLVEKCRRHDRVALGVRQTTLLDEPLEPVRIDLLGLELNEVAARTRHEQVGLPERLAQPRHLVIEAVARRPGRPVAPQLVDQPVARDQRVRT